MTFTVPPTGSLALFGIVPGSRIGGGEGRRELVVRVVDATLDVAPKGLGFVGVGVPKGPEGLVGYMWDCSGRLGKTGIKWDMPKSSAVVANAATGFVGAGFTAGCCECN